MDEISSFRDKYLKEYRVKNTNLSILKKAKYVSFMTGKMNSDFV